MTDTIKAPESRKPARIIKTVLNSVEIAGVVERRRGRQVVRMIRPYPDLEAELPEEMASRLDEHGDAVFEAALVLLFTKARRYLDLTEQPDAIWVNVAEKLTSRAIEAEERRWRQRYENWLEVLKAKSRTNGDEERYLRFLAGLRKRLHDRMASLHEARRKLEQDVLDSQLSLEDFVNLRSHFGGRQNGATNRQGEYLTFRETIDRINLSELGR